MEQKRLNMMMASRKRTKEDIAELRQYVKENIPNDIIQFRKRIQMIDSDTLPAIIGDVQDRYSPILLICGRQRRGKTRFGLTLANIFSVFLYYRKFDYTTSFFVNPLSMLKGITDDGNQILVLDEAGSKGSGLNKNEWWSNAAGLFDYCLQTQGNLNNIYIFILPQAPDIIIDVRKYLDYVFGARKRGEFFAWKIYKKEDKVVRHLKEDMRQVPIETLTFKLSDLPDDIWIPVEKIVNDMKSQTRKDKIEKMESKGDWLRGG